MNDFIHKESYIIEDQAFVDGANGVPQEYGLSEIQGQCGRRKAELRRDAALVIQRLDAHAKTLRALADAAQDHWAAVKQEHGTIIPRLIPPLLLLATSALAAVANGGPSNKRQARKDPKNTCHSLPVYSRCQV